MDGIEVGDAALVLAGVVYALVLGSFVSLSGVRALSMPCSLFNAAPSDCIAAAEDAGLLDCVSLSRLAA